jgi:hypothetical protein
MPSSGMWSRVDLVRTDVSDELNASETSVHTTYTRRHTADDDILRSHRRENLKSYISLDVSQRAMKIGCLAFCGKC